MCLFKGGQVWLKDKEASQCKLCEKEFSISRRKVSSIYLTYPNIYPDNQKKKKKKPIIKQKSKARIKKTKKGNPLLTLKKFTFWYANF